MRMLCWMCVNITLNKIKNENIQEYWSNNYSRKDSEKQTEVLDI